MLTAQAMGNLGRDPEIKATQSGVKLAQFSLATNKKIKGEKVTTWVNVTVFDENKIKFIEQYVRKGTKLFVEGEPQARAWLKDGEAKSSLDLVLSYGSKMEIASSDNAGGTASSPAAGAKSDDNWGTDNSDLDDDFPPY